MLRSGIRLENFDRSVSPGDDFFRYVNGEWLKRTEIPSDQARYGAFIMLDENVKAAVKEIIEELGRQNAATEGPARQVGDFYRSYMDVETRNAAGLDPIQTG